MRFETADVATQAALEDRYAFHRDGVAALTAVRRHALLIAQVCLAACVWREGLVGKLLTIMLGLSVLRLLLGSLALYGGLTSLYAIADPMYFVTTGTIYPLLACFAWRVARRH